MIFVTIGMNNAPYEKLFEVMDEYQNDTGEKVVMQIGRSEFVPKYAEAFSYTDEDRLKELYDTCDVMVCHAGVGTIMNGLTRNKPLVLVPRIVVMPSEGRAQQEVIAEKVEKMGRGFCVMDIESVPKAIDDAKKLKFEPYVKSTALHDYIDGLLSDLDKKLKEGKKLR